MGLSQLERDRHSHTSLPSGQFRALGGVNTKEPCSDPFPQDPSLPSDEGSLAVGGVNPSVQPFRYIKGQFLVINTSNLVEEFRYKLKIKKAKVEAWWWERGRHYWDEGYRFVALTLTFKDEKAFEEFEEWGGRRRFMDYWKKENKGAIMDYVCVAEFQQRGVIHYHYLIVCKRGVKLTYPDKTVFKWGMSNLKELRGPRKAYQYLVSYIKKLDQLDYERYARWKAKFGKFRLYEFGRPNVSKRGALRMVEKGWGRALYFKVLKDRQGWRWVGNILKLLEDERGERVDRPPPEVWEFWSEEQKRAWEERKRNEYYEWASVFVSAGWDVVRENGQMFLFFKGFSVDIGWYGKVRGDVFSNSLVLEFRSLDDLLGFVRWLGSYRSVWELVNDVWEGQKNWLPSD